MKTTSNFLNTKSVCERYGFVRQTLWRRINKRLFPSPTGRNKEGYVWERKLLDTFDEAIRKKVMETVRVAVANC